MNKQDILQMVDRLPNPFDPEQLMHELYLRAKLEKAEEAIERGEVVAHEEVVQRSKQWFE